MAYGTFTLTGRYKLPDGTANAGTGRIVCNTGLRDAAGDDVLAGPIGVTLDGTGAFSKVLPAADVALQPQPHGFTLTMALHSGSVNPVSFAAPAPGTTLAVADIADSVLPPVLVPNAATAQDVAAATASAAQKAANLSDLASATTARTNLGLGTAATQAVAAFDAAGAATAAVDAARVVPRWAPATVYTLGQQVVSPLNDVVSANVGHTSAAAYAADVAKWVQSSTYVWQGPAPSGASQSAAINADMVALAAAGGGKYRLRAGAYEGDTLKIPGNVRLQGHSLGYTTYKHTAGALGDAVVTNLSFWTYADGTGSPDPSWVPREDNVGVENITIDGNKAVVAGRYGIIIRPCTNVTLKNVNVKNAGLTGTMIQASTKVKVSDYQSSGCNLNGLFVIDCTDFKVDGVLIDGCGDYGVEIGAGGDYGSPGSPALPGNGTVSNVIAKNCTNFGVCVRGIKDATANPTNRKVSNVTLSNITATGNAYGIGMQELVSDITWTGVVSRLNTTGGRFAIGAGGPTGRSKIAGIFTDNTGDGISAQTLTDTDFDVTVMRNGHHGMSGSYVDCRINGTVRNNGTATPGTYDNVTIDATSADVHILGADLTDRGTRTARYDLNGNSQNRVIAKGCTIGIIAGMTDAPDMNAPTIVKQTLAAGAGGGIDPRKGSIHIITLTGTQSAPTYLPGTVPEGTIITIEYVQGGAGSYGYQWPTACLFAGGAAPAASTAVGRGDSVTFRFNGGVGYYHEIGRAIGVPSS